MATKDFVWEDGPDPSRWNWVWDGYRSLVLPRGEGDARIIAKHYGKAIKIFADGKALGVRQSAAKLREQMPYVWALWHGDHLVLHAEDCVSWRHGIELVESWLDTIGIWGTPADIRWCGFTEAP